MPLTLPQDVPARLDPMRVMLVEDEALVAMLVEDDLLDAGATVLGTASSVNQALRMVDQVVSDGGMDACLLDLNLGGESAVPVADMLADRSVPFLFMTGYQDAGRQDAHTGVPTLRKPFSPRDLIIALQRLIRPASAASV